MSVLSNSDHQIVTLAARPPHNYYSGCTLQTRYPDAKPPLPISTPFPPHGGIGGADTVTSYYDQFLTPDSRSTTTAAPEEASGSGGFSTDGDLLLLDDAADDAPFNFTGFNETDVFNASTALQGRRHGGSFSSLENRLEHDSAYRDDVEQLFAAEPPADGQPTLVRLRRSMPAPMTFKREGVGTVLVTCTNIGGFTSSRERWWYIAIANCGSRKGLDLKYKFRLTNGPPGDFWHEHFSADEMCEFIAHFK